MEEGRKYLVYIYVDEQTDRIVASSRLKRFIAKGQKVKLKKGEEVDIIIVKKTDLGFKVIINQEYWGLIYANEVFRSLRIGTAMKAYVKNIRDEFKIDITLQQQGVAGMSDAAQLVLNHLEEVGGFLPLTDKSPPEKIYKSLKMSKKAFKRAIGNLYKKRIIRIEKKGVRLLES